MSTAPGGRPPPGGIRTERTTTGPARTLRPDDPAVLVGFAVAAAACTAAAGLVGAAVGAGELDPAEALGADGAAFLRLWSTVAVLVAVLLPTAVPARWSQAPGVRRALVPYVGLLGVQTGTEAAMPRVLPSWTVLVSAGLHPAFRLWQLRAARDHLDRPGPGRRPARAVSAGCQAFWGADLVVLGASAVRLLRRGRGLSGPAGAR